MVNTSFPYHKNQFPSSLDEQFVVEPSSLCIECGMCCNGTMFSYATISEDDSKYLKSLQPQGHEYKSIRTNRIKMPCDFLDANCCSIYQTPRAEICRDYSCRLLKLTADYKLSQKEALEVIKTAKIQSTWLFENCLISKEVLVKHKINQNSLRDLLGFIHRYYKQKHEKKFLLDQKELEYCLNSFDYLKTLALYFTTSSLLHKYRALLQSITTK